MRTHLPRPAHLGAPLALAAFLVAGALPASASGGDTGPVTWAPGPGPAVRCAYDAGSPATLQRIRVDGPRVGFPLSVGEVGWVRWTTLLQQRLPGSSDWTTIATRQGRVGVTAGTLERFPDRELDVPAGPTGALVRVVSRLRWIDQGFHEAGVLRHVMRRHGRVQVGAGDPIEDAIVVVDAAGPCPRSWDVA
ncbi:MAG: hypothetical protein U0869_12120 [Chloroflexota bacterium]